MLETHTFVVLIFVCLVFLGGGLCLFAGVKGFVSARWGEGSLFWSHGSVYCMLESWFCLLHAGVRISLPSTCWSPSSVSAHWGQGSLVWSLSSVSAHWGQGSLVWSLSSVSAHWGQGSLVWSLSSVSAHWGQGSLVWSLFISHQSQGSVYCSLESGFCLLHARVRVLCTAC